MDYETRKQLMLAKYCYKLYDKEVKKLEAQEKKHWDNLEKRKQVWDAHYTSMEELEAAYMIGSFKGNDKEYYAQRVAVWQVYGDKYRGVKMAYFRPLRDQWKARYEALQKMADDQEKKWVDTYRKRVRREQHMRNYWKHYRRKERARKMKEEGRKPRPKTRKRVQR